jgi:hypothetical protein
MILVALRTPQSWLHQGFYAEDGVIFFQDQVVFGWRAIFRPYAGYLHLMPRLAALIASATPVVARPFAFALFSAIVQSLAASFFFLPQNRAVVGSDAIRLGVSVLALVDFPAHEMLNNVMDLQWYVMPVAILILCQVGLSAERVSTKLVIAYCFLMALIGLSAPMLLIGFPIVAILLFRANGPERLVPATLAAALTIQGLVFFVIDPQAQPNEKVQHTMSFFTVARPVTATVGAWIYRDVLAITLGAHGAKFLAAHFGEALALASFAAVLLLAAVLSKSWTRKERVLLLSLVAASIALVSTALVLRGLIQFFGDLTSFSFFDHVQRYFCTPGWLVLVAAGMVIDRGRSVSQQPVYQLGILFAIFGIGAVSNYRGEVLPDTHWETGVPAIERWIQQNRTDQPTQQVIVPISPSGWGVNLPERKAIESLHLASKRVSFVQPNGYFVIVSKLSGKVLDVTNFSTVKGAGIQQWDYLGALNQEWLIKYASGRGSGVCDPNTADPTAACFFKIESRSSGLILEVTNSSTRNGAPIDQWCSGPPNCASNGSPNTNQEWILRPIGDGYFKIVSASSGLLLEVTGGAGATANGNVIDQWADVGGDNQIWQFVKVVSKP